MKTRPLSTGGTSTAQDTVTTPAAPASPVTDQTQAASTEDDLAIPLADQVGVMCQASAIEIGIGGDGCDPFDATLLLAGPDTSDREIAVWTRLTPPVITDLLEQLQDLLLAQHESLGITPDTVDDPPGTEDDPHPGWESNRVKRFLDPMGLRHLKARSASSTMLLAIGIASLLVLTVIVQLVRP